MEQSSSEGNNSKEGATIVSANKDFVGKKGLLKRNKKSKSKNLNSFASKHENTSSGHMSSANVELTQKPNQPHSNLSQSKTNNNTNNNNEPSSPMVSMETKKTESLNNLKEPVAVVISETSSVDKPETVTDAPVEVPNKLNNNCNSVPQKGFLLPTPAPVHFEKITSPVDVTPEPQPRSAHKSNAVMTTRLLEPRANQPTTNVPNNPWPKYAREVQRCVSSLDRLNDELNLNCDCAANEISDLFGEMQMALQNREHYLQLELETLRNTASALLAERWDAGMVLKKKVSRLNASTADCAQELQQEIQQYIADRKLDKDIANKCRFVANRREGLHYTKNFGCIESVLPIYNSLIMANAKLKPDDVFFQEMPYSVVEVIPAEMGYNETVWTNTQQMLPLDFNSYGPYTAVMNPLKDMQIISLDQMMFFQPQPVMPATPIKTRHINLKLEPVAIKAADDDQAEPEPLVDTEFSKLSAEELLVIQNRVRESLLKQGVKLYPPDGIEGDRNKPLLTSAQREKKRQKRHRYRERKRLERRAERMEQVSDSSNSIEANPRHKKLSHKKDRNKSKSTSDNEELKSPSQKDVEATEAQSKLGAPAVLCKTNGKITQKRMNSEQSDNSVVSNSVTDTPESSGLTKPRSSTASYAENTTSGEDPSVLDDANMFPASEATEQVFSQSGELPPNETEQTKLTPHVENNNTVQSNSTLNNKTDV